MRFAGAHKGPKLIQEFVGAELVGIIGIEIGKERIEVIPQYCLGRLHAAEQRHRPRPWTRPAMRIAYVRRQRVTASQFRPRTFSFLTGGSSLLGALYFDFDIAPLGIYEFAVIAKAHMVAREIVPEESGAGIIHVGLITFKRIFVSDLSLKIVGALLAAIGDRTGLQVVVGDNRGSRQMVAVAGDFAAVVEVVENAKLQREFVLVGRDVFAVHGQRRIAIADLQVAENLIVGAVFLDDIDDVLDGILAAGESDGAGIAVEQVGALHCLRELRKFFES